MTNNLDTFKILYIVKGCILAFFAIVIFGYLMYFSSLFNSNNTDFDFHYNLQTEGNELPFDIVNAIQYITYAAIAIVLFSIAFTVSHFITAYYLNKKRHYTLL